MRAKTSGKLETFLMVDEVKVCAQYNRYMSDLYVLEMSFMLMK